MAVFIYLIVVVILLIFFVYLYSNLRRAYKKLEHDYRSMYVKHGQHFESFVPFMDDYPGMKENTVFIGQPVDFISFDDDSVKFIEVKTGKSGLNEKQRRVKDLVQNRNVRWYELRFEK